MKNNSQCVVCGAEVYAFTYCMVCGQPIENDKKEYRIEEDEKSPEIDVNEEGKNE